MSAAEPGDSPSVAADVDDDLEFQAARKGSAEELLDADAHDPLDPMRHSAAHVMAEAVMDLFPGTQPRHRAGHRGRLLLRLRAAPTTDPGGPGRHRGAHGCLGRGRPSLRAPGVGSRRGARLPGDGRPALQGRDPRRPAQPPPPSAASRRPPVTTYQHGPFIDLCRGPHVESTGQHRPLQAALRGRRLLARPRGPAHAAAHLRHGLVEPGGAGPLPVAAGGGAQARPPPPRRGPRPVQLPRHQPGLGLLAPQGPAPLAHPGGRPCASSRSGAATRR